MTRCTTDNVRQFILGRYADRWAELSTRIEHVPDDFDLLLEGVIDSVGVLDLIAAIEDEFDVDIDLQELDAEHITVIGPLAQYIGQSAQPRPAEFS